VWIEVKYLAGLSGGTQLRTYERALARPALEETHKHLLLLVPAWRVGHFGQLERASRDATWDHEPRVATWNDALAALASARPRAQSARWLLKEALRFFEGMEMQPSRQLQSKHVRTLKALPETLEALDALVDGARDTLERQDGLTPVRDGVTREVGYIELTWHIRSRARWPRGSRLYFGVEYDKCFAGVRLSSGRVEDHDAFDRYVDAGWDYETRELWRSKPLNTILDVPHQAEALCAFVRSTFEQLASGPDPTRTTAT
jgi:hypothetical protein